MAFVKNIEFLPKEAISHLLVNLHPSVQMPCLYRKAVAPTVTLWGPVPCTGALLVTEWCVFFNETSRKEGLIVVPDDQRV